MSFFMRYSVILWNFLMYHVVFIFSVTDKGFIWLLVPHHVLIGAGAPLLFKTPTASKPKLASHSSWNIKPRIPHGTLEELEPTAVAQYFIPTFMATCSNQICSSELMHQNSVRWLVGMAENPSLCLYRAQHCFLITATNHNNQSKWK